MSPAFTAMDVREIYNGTKREREREREDKTRGKKRERIALMHFKTFMPPSSGERRLELTNVRAI
jgi:hypothetical protein